MGACIEKRINYMDNTHGFITGYVDVMSKGQFEI